MSKKKQIRIHGFGEEVLWDKTQEWPVPVVDECFEESYTLFQALLRQSHHYATFAFPGQDRFLTIRDYEMTDGEDPQIYTVTFGKYVQNEERYPIEDLSEVTMDEQELVDFLRELDAPWDQPVWYPADSCDYGMWRRKKEFKQYVLRSIKEEK